MVILKGHKNEIERAFVIWREHSFDHKIARLKEWATSLRFCIKSLLVCVKHHILKITVVEHRLSVCLWGQLWLPLQIWLCPYHRATASSYDVTVFLYCMYFLSVNLFFFTSMQGAIKPNPLVVVFEDCITSCDCCCVLSILTQTFYHIQHVPSVWIYWQMSHTWLH